MSNRLSLIIMNINIANHLTPKEIKNYMSSTSFSENYPFQLMLKTVKKDILDYLINPNSSNPFTYNNKDHAI